MKTNNNKCILCNKPNCREWSGPEIRICSDCISKFVKFLQFGANKNSKLFLNYIQQCKEKTPNGIYQESISTMTLFYDPNVLYMML